MKMVFAISLSISVGVLVGILMRGPSPQANAADEKCASKNGDVNADGWIDLSDAVYLLKSIFLHGQAPISMCLPKGGALPATGQTKCYDAGGNEIDCASPDFPGQDAVYQEGCPIAGRFIDNADGTVTDTCTGLMWQKATPDLNGDGIINSKDQISWQEALHYCKNLELAGYSDWRLPNVRELQSIVDYGKYDPSTDPIFGSEPHLCWSSSTYVHVPTRAWYIVFGDGYVVSGAKEGDLYRVRAVRGPQ